MNLQVIINRLTEGASSPAFLTGIGVTGTITTAFFTGRAGFKAAERIEMKREELRLEALKAMEELKDQPEEKAKIKIEEPSPREKLETIWPLFVTPVSIGATTIAAIIMANRQASRKIAALTVASGISERAFAEYKAKVAEKITKAKQTEIRDSIAQDRVNANPPSSSEVIILSSGDVLCFDVNTGRYFQSSVEKIRQAEVKMNMDIMNHMYASLSSFYDRIGIPPTPYSDTVGWNADHRCGVTFSTVMSPDQRPCVAIDFEVPPFPEYNRLY